MGILHLMTYMKRYSKGCEHVKLAEIAQKYKNEMKKEPVILVDIASCVRGFAEMGRLQFPLEYEKNLKEHLEKFINNCFEIGIRLKFVGDGMKCVALYHSWILDMTKKLNENCEIQEIQVDTHLGVLHNLCIRVIRMNAGKCEYLRALYNRKDYIIRYAKTHGCFAILNYDSDYLFSEAAEYLLSAADLDLKTMSAVNFNRNILACSLKMSPSTLPVFGALMGQQPFNCKRPFFVSVELFFKVAEEAEKLSMADDPQQVGPESEMFHYLLQRYSGSILEEDLTLYDDENWNKILQKSRGLNATGVQNRHILEILANRVYFFYPKSKQIYDFDIAYLLQLLRRKVYGILFCECPDKKATVTEYTALLRNNRARVDIRTISPFECSFPVRLLDLWSEDNSEEVAHQRRVLFCKALHPELTPEILDATELPEEFLFPALVLFYLNWETDRKLEPWEWTVLLFQMILTKELGDTKLDDAAGIDAKLFELTSPFLNTVEHLQLLNSVCGEPLSLEKTQETNFYNFAVSLSVYKKVKTGVDCGPLLSARIWQEAENLMDKIIQMALDCGHTVKDEKLVWLNDYNQCEKI